MSATNESKPQFNELLEVSNGFYNLRAPFYVMGCLDVGTHMSLCRLNNGNFLVVDTTPMSVDSVAKREIDLLTDNGKLIEAVFATHPYHTVYFDPFHKLYPSTHIKWYGTSRHIENFKSVPWETDPSCIIEPNSLVLDKWQSQGVSMRIPEGAEFINPGHFSCVFVFHYASRTLHVDDTLQFFDSHTGWVLDFLIFSLLRTPRGTIVLHSSAFNDAADSGLFNTELAAGQFSTWLRRVCEDWDFDSLCTAHKGKLLSGAKQLTLNMLAAYEPKFKSYSAKHKGK